jgi:hypothetical protein
MITIKYCQIECTNHQYIQVSLATFNGGYVHTHTLQWQCRFCGKILNS